MITPLTIEITEPIRIQGKLLYIMYIIERNIIMIVGNNKKVCV